MYGVMCGGVMCNSLMCDGMDYFTSDMILILDFVLICFLCRNVVWIVFILTGMVRQLEGVRPVVMMVSIGGVWEDGCDGEGEGM